MRPPILNPLFRPVSSLAGIGPKLAVTLRKLLGGPEPDGEPRAIDLLFHLPVAIIDRSRRAAVADRRLSEYAQQLEQASEPDPSHAEQVCQCVRALVDTLKPDYSMALEQVDLAGKSLADYAQEAGITANNAGVRVHRARKALRKEVIGFCRMCAEYGCVDCSCKKPQGHSVDP